MSMAYATVVFAQASSLRSLRECEIGLTPILILFAVLAVFTFAGDKIAKAWKEKVGSKTRKVLIVAAILAVVVIAVATGVSLTSDKEAAQPSGALGDKVAK
ncbi:MAG: hypothetical protein PHX41_04855 [Kiritimatiellae bacterium]|nr:hypothetical protein [Kiritimatiellia bacterium]